jgi:hypothetical protein
MQGIQIQEAKAPWVMFETRGEEDREASLREGRYVAKDVDYVLITPHGSRDQIERVATEWFDHLQTEVGQGRFEAAWLRAYKNAYENWKEGRELPQSGTPILNWPVLSPSQVRMLQDLRILTLEVLAAANEETIRRLGMGGRNLVQKAKDFLAQAEGPGKITQEMSFLRTQNEELMKTVQNLNDTVQALRAQIGTKDASSGEQPLEQGSNGIGANDLLDAPAKAPLKKL